MKANLPGRGPHWGRLRKTSGQQNRVLSVLNDLIRVNIDRITAYEKAAHEEMSSGPEIRDVFYRLATDSRSYVNDLHAEVIRMGGAPVTQSTIAGKLYLHWLNGKVNFDGETLVSRCAACVHGEELIQQVYRHALDSGALPRNLQDLVERQLWSLERARERLVKVVGETGDKDRG
ncbi:PA2169 family four-helix-bundle protein [Puia sp. P3]|uniref:PA2169 family four-helix-bundle protein n=1 Tax=Puia sp. P3 TaxID=3423952 RepID=UPI003D672F2E